MKHAGASECARIAAQDTRARGHARLAFFWRRAGCHWRPTIQAPTTQPRATRRVRMSTTGCRAHLPCRGEHALVDDLLPLILVRFVSFRFVSCRFSSRLSPRTSHPTLSPDAAVVADQWQMPSRCLLACCGVCSVRCKAKWPPCLRAGLRLPGPSLLRARRGRVQQEALRLGVELPSQVPIS